MAGLIERVARAVDPTDWAYFDKHQSDPLCHLARTRRRELAAAAVKAVLAEIEGHATLDEAVVTLRRALEDV